MVLPLDKLNGKCRDRIMIEGLWIEDQETLGEGCEKDAMNGIVEGTRGVQGVLG